MHDSFSFGTFMPHADPVLSAAPRSWVRYHFMSQYLRTLLIRFISCSSCHFVQFWRRGSLCCFSSLSKLLDFLACNLGSICNFTFAICGTSILAYVRPLFPGHGVSFPRVNFAYHAGAQVFEIISCGLITYSVDFYAQKGTAPFHWVVLFSDPRLWVHRFRHHIVDIWTCLMFPLWLGHFGMVARSVVKGPRQTVKGTGNDPIAVLLQDQGSSASMRSVNRRLKIGYKHSNLYITDWRLLKEAKRTLRRLGYKPARTEPQSRRGSIMLWATSLQAVQPKSIW